MQHANMVKLINSDMQNAVKEMEKDKKGYHMHENSDVAQKHVKIFCDRNQFPILMFCGPHKNPHGVTWLGKHYHIRFYPKLGHSLCSILWISCTCAECTSMLDKHWVPSLLPQQKPRYQPVHECT